jgi:L-serine deaminase
MRLGRLLTCNRKVVFRSSLLKGWSIVEKHGFHLSRFALPHERLHSREPRSYIRVISQAMRASCECVTAFGMRTHKSAHAMHGNTRILKM